jgi:putative salt-induced outer membrane protein YdiY
MKQSTVFLLICLPFFSFSQVINTEKLRQDNIESGWLGDLELNFGLTRNKAGRTVRLGTRGRLEYLYKKQRILLFGGYNLTQFLDVDDTEAVPKNFANNGFGHIRYNVEASPAVTWEAFVQGQFDEIQEIDRRHLVGTGPRFRLVENDSLQLFFGMLYMYENEASNDLIRIGEAEEEIDVTRNHHRLSTYLSLGWRLNENVVLNHVSYFQPRPDRWDDFRVSTETSLEVDLSRRLRFKTYFQLVYDAQPPTAVPETMYMLTNGLSFVW